MTEQNIANVTETSKSAGNGEDAAEQLVETAVGLGRLWARHGLTLGRLALETSAETLGTTARLLGGIADAFARDAAQAEPSEKA